MDVAALQSFAKERADEGKRAGKVMLGIFPLTSKSVFQLKNPSDYALVAEPWTTDFLCEVQGVAICVYSLSELDRLGATYEHVRCFLLAILAHTHVVAVMEGERILPPPYSIGAILDRFDPDIVPTEVLRRLDEDTLRHFNERVDLLASERRGQAEMVLDKNPDVVTQNPGRVVAILLPEQSIAGIGDTPGEALAQSIENYGSRRFVFVRIPPAHPYAAF
ncbi:MAG: hypothetical protein ACE5QF_09680 [Thermoplasmata archaeon]